MFFLVVYGIASYNTAVLLLFLRMKSKNNDLDYDDVDDEVNGAFSGASEEDEPSHTTVSVA